ncbi:hypothetical protein [Roseateles cavernae]|uniref:hypothetical protein n=1 Tax=Roseateles cavernae TaxID=3153578 RepID=UPI0032E473E6
MPTMPDAPSRPASPSPAPAEQTLQLLEQADAALARQQWSVALALATQALSPALPDAQRAQALLMQARAHWQMGALWQVYLPALEVGRLGRLCGNARTEVDGLSLAAFALAELGLADEARPISLEALAAAGDSAELLPRTLSCAAHVHARLGDVSHAELMHMRAISLARESHDSNLLALAFINLLLSLSLAYEELLHGPGEAAAQIALVHAPRFLAQASGLLADERLPLTARASLQLAAAHLALLCGRLDQAEPWLTAAHRQYSEQGTGYNRLAAEQSLAELALRRGRPAEGLAWLDGLLAPAPGHGSFNMRLPALRTALACHRALGQAEAERAVAVELDELLRARQAMREQALGVLHRPELP